MWIYQSFEPGLWTVGFYSPSGKFVPESDHGSFEEASKRTHYLNGGNDDAKNDVRPMPKKAESDKKPS